MAPALRTQQFDKFLNMKKRELKPSLEGYTEPEAKKENMMNVGELNKKIFAESKSAKKA